MKSRYKSFTEFEKDVFPSRFYERRARYLKEKETARQNLSEFYKY